MTTPASTDAKEHVSHKTEKLPHERDESHDGTLPPDKPEIQQAYEAVQRGQGDTSKAEGTDATYNSGAVSGDDRKSGTAAGRTKPDPAAQK